MTLIQPVAEPAPRPWGYIATFLWALLAAIASMLASVAALAILVPDALAKSIDIMADMRTFSIVGLASFAALIAVVAGAARLKGWRPVDYLALTPPSGRDAAIAFATVAAFALGYDLLTYVLGRDVVTPFQIEAYRNARDAGALAALVIVFVVGAPLGEEIVFRGFLFRGWVQKPRDVVPAVILISATWAVLHSQYDWFGVVQIFVLGLVLGWVRWRSGSTLLTILLHAAINAWATLQTVIAVEWL